MKRFFLFSMAMLFLTPLFAVAADNELTPAEKAEGWVLLFNGKDYAGWINSNGAEIKSAVEEDSMQTFECGGYILSYDELFGDFVLKCDIKMDDPCNSGIFLRMENLEDPVNTGFEIQVATTGDKVTPNSHGSLYDVKAPTKNATKGSGQWDHFEVVFVGSNLSVSLNGEEVTTVNLDDYTEPGQRDVEGNHKFALDGKPRILKDFARTGYIGFQDHGHKCWIKNVKILPLEKRKKLTAIVTIEGKPLSNAVLVFSPKDNPENKSFGTTDEHGNATMEAKPGEYSTTIEK